MAKSDPSLSSEVSPFSVELKGLTKQFGTCVANAGIDLQVHRGSIHGIVGENGAGKSTAMKMLYGVYAPDKGEIYVNGTLRRWSSPHAAIDVGIGMVHQHFMLAEPFTALDNILLGAEPVKKVSRFLPHAFRWIDREAARVKLTEIGKQYGLEVPLDSPVGMLPVGIQQRIEILKLLYREAQILILDEPTAVLTPYESLALFANLRRLKAEGKTVLIITHKLREVMDLTDEVTIFRSGRTVSRVKTAKTSPEELASLMVGHAVTLNLKVDHGTAVGKAVLETKQLFLKGAPGSHANGMAKPQLAGIDLQVLSGEIVGVAGVEGNGQTELVEAILHPSSSKHRTSGMVKVCGQDVTAFATSKVKGLGVGVIPYDRHREGLLLNSNLTDNCLLGHQRDPELAQFGLISSKAARQFAEKIVHDHDVRPGDLAVEAGQLSGGNQQKLIIGRELAREPHLIIAARPTRGVDVGAIEFIHKGLVAARDKGAGILLISSDLDEIMSLSDRVVVMYEGAIVASYPRGKYTLERLGMHMGGASSAT